MKRKRGLVKNSAFGILQTFANALLVFITLPVFIRTLGNESYGVFALVTLVGNLNVLTNLGLSVALVKFIAEQGHQKKSDIDILVSLVLTSLGSGTVALIAILFENFVLIKIMRVPPPFLSQAHLLYFWAVCANIVLMIGGVFKSVLDGMQKIYVTSLEQIIYSLSYWGFMLAALLMGSDLEGVGVAIFFSAFLWFILITITCFVNWGKVSIRNANGGFRESAVKQLRYSVKIYTSGLLSLFAEPLMKILISNYIGVVAVGVIDVATRLRNQLSRLVGNVFYPLYPFLSEERDLARVRKYVRDLEQKTFLIVIPIVSVVILATYPFVDVWLDTNVNAIAWTAVVMIGLYLLGSSTMTPLYHYLLAKDLPQKAVIMQFFNTFFFVLFFLASVRFIGFGAFILGYFSAIVNSFVLSVYYQKKYLDATVFDSPKQILNLLFVLAANLVSGLVVAALLPTNVEKIIGSVIAVGVSSLIGYRHLRVIDPDDVIRYTGRNSKVAKLGIKILCRA